MQKLFEQMSARVAAFLEQRETLLLVVRAGTAEYLPLVSAIKGIEDAGSGDGYWLFTEPFMDSRQYVKALVANFRSQYEVLAPLLIKEGLKLPMPISAILQDERAPEIERLRAMWMLARSMNLDAEDGRIVVGLLPSNIKNPTAFAQLVTTLLTHEKPVPWCHHMRFIVREMAEQSLLYQQGKALPYATFFAPDMGPKAIQQSLEDEANNSKVPLGQRMQSLLLLAGLDLANRRYPEAIEKYGLLAKYHKAVGPKTLYALSLNGIGETYERAGNPKEALKYYEQALTPAFQAKSPPALINVTTNLANLHRQNKSWPMAYAYYQCLAALAKSACSVELLLRCLEQMGFCKHKMGDVKAAWEHWNEGVVLAREMESKEHRLDCLQRIRGLYKELGLSDRRKAIEPEIEQLERQGVRPYPA